MTKLEELQNKPRGKRTPLEQCIVDAATFEEAEHDGELELMEKAAEDLQNIHDLLKQHEDDTRAMSEMLIRQVRHARMINRLANIVLDAKGVRDNDRYEAEQAIELVRSLL